MNASSRSCRPFRSAFTLIELLVVIAIIMILAAILFPVFGRAREQARKASCQSNLKQIGLGLLQYSQDYDEYLIADWYGDSTSSTQPATTSGGRYKWPDAAYPYIRSEQVFMCPSGTGDAAKPWVYYGNLKADSTVYSSYIIMHGYGTNEPTRTPPVSHPTSGNLVSMAQVQAASTTAWVLDGDGTFYCVAGTDGIGNITARHSGLINVLYVDGHVKATVLSQVNKKNAAGNISAATIQDD